MITIEISIGAAVLISSVIAAVLYISKLFIAARIKESVRKETNIQVEKLKSSLDWQSKKKLQATEVAEMYSLWHKWKYFPKMTKDETRYELQKKYWELCLWLDEELLKEVNTSLENKDELAHKKAMVKVRKLVLGQNDNITVNDITHFLSDMEIQNSANPKD